VIDVLWPGGHGQGCRPSVVGGREVSIGSMVRCRSWAAVSLKQ
jgi:hypothetical protein